MASYLARRLLVSVPLLLAISLLAFLLSKVSGTSYFDQYKVDPRFDPAVVREMERRAHLDQPVLLQYLHWLRGVLCDVRIFHRERELRGFEQPPAEIAAWITMSGTAAWHRTALDSFAGRCSLLIDGGEHGGAALIALPQLEQGETLVAQARAQSVATIVVDGRSVVLEPRWQPIASTSVRRPQPAALTVSVPPGARVYLDAIRARGAALSSRSVRPSSDAPSSTICRCST
ncbi:MAG: hypothetical protein U1E76_13270 [Planctomycetota bacterium]